MNAPFRRSAAAVALGLAASCPDSLFAQTPTTAESAAPIAVPYAWRNVAIGGGGFVTGIIFHPRAKELYYARTDVGGAYRWDSAVRRWIPITDWIGAEDVNLTGIESLAVDPADAGRVYLAAGTYNGKRAAILRSDDQGKTFQRADVPFAMGGNETGRANGERLAVDPHQGQILFFGSRHDGLWKSSDRAATWNRVETFSARSDAEPVGIVSIVFEAASGRSGEATPVVYAACSSPATNLFRSSDGGVHWDAVPGQPLGFRPNHIVPAPDGLFYLSYGKEPGPNTMSDGAIWKYNSKSGNWTDITPVKPSAEGGHFGYGAVAVDAQHPSVLMATTFAHWQPHDEIFRSTNAGANWQQVWTDETQWDHSSAPYTSSRTPHWMGSIAINPFNSGQVLFTTGYGIWSCADALAADSGKPMRWVFFDDGLEETVPLALLSPAEGAHLLSGLGDIDGFRHDDLSVSPPQGTYEGPRFGNTEDLAVAGRKPQILARTGTTRTRGQTRAAYSIDGGKSWTAFDSEPARSAGAGTIAVSADGNKIVWTPRRSVPHFSVDYGKHWFASEGLASGLRVVADTVNPARFYAYNARENKLYVSTNGAAAFAPSSVEFPQSDGFEGGFGGGGGDGVMVYAAPDASGDLWLAFRRGGLMHSTDAGLSFDRIAGVQQAASMGFGAAAPGKTYPALYLAGKINGSTGLFRSDDTGRSWVRINDSQHQFGWINHVTGDPRVFGRVYFATGGRGIIYGDPAVDSNSKPAGAR